MKSVYLSIFFLVAAMAVVIGSVAVAPLPLSLACIIGLAFLACMFLSLVFWDKSMDEE